MKSILKELYYGNIDPSDKKIKRTPYYDKINNELDKCENILYDYFKENKLEVLYEVFKRTVDLNNEINSYEKSERFADGFILCAGLVTEIRHKILDSYYTGK